MTSALINRRSVRRVLFITSNEGFRDSFSSFLRMNDFDVVQSGHGFQALNLLENSPIPVMIVIIGPDIQVLTAPEVISLIRARYAKKDLPIIQVLNVNDKEEGIDTVTKSFVNELIKMPLAPIWLLKKIQECLSLQEEFKE
ncbi:MAG: hypothetical protein HQK50_10845 [Oligoflexia bacterium]|nr:hypothetical protein [Oligoflexia bacterium]MBF0366059.1 hypothetical protein [Oligoflexia bacterium]